MRIDTLALQVGLTVGEPAQETAQRAEAPAIRPGGPDRLDLASGLPPGVLSEIARGLSGGASLPPDVLAWARAAYGVDLSHVQVIADDRSRRLNEAADTYGLAVGDRQILLRDPLDQATLYHEAAHMAQAAAGHTGGRQQREADAARAEQVFARRAGPGSTGATAASASGAVPPGIDLQRLADHVYKLLVRQLESQRQRRF